MPRTTKTYEGASTGGKRLRTSSRAGIGHSGEVPDAAPQRPPDQHRGARDDHDGAGVAGWAGRP
ncbi:hypothetical protein [Streptomyces sp. NBC_01530]|uniref:hypothetical protein n=1 Tax=Streptomyces sp. NBC_01530 TaxID=2903895 RepID=UPI00386512FA